VVAVFFEWLALKIGPRVTVDVEVALVVVAAGGGGSRRVQEMNVQAYHESKLMGISLALIGKGRLGNGCCCCCW